MSSSSCHGPAAIPEHCRIWTQIAQERDLGKGPGPAPDGQWSQGRNGPSGPQWWRQVSRSLGGRKCVSEFIVKEEVSVGSATIEEVC